MYSLVCSAVVYGVDGLCVDIETKISRGLPCYQIVGLPDKTVRESKERIRAAIESLDISFPARRMTLNLIPAETPKDGSHLDLPMAIGILTAVDHVPFQVVKGIAFFGELSLDGRLLPVLGLLPMVLSLMERGICKFIIPKGAEVEINFVKGLFYKAFDNLSAVIAFLKESPLTEDFICGNNSIMTPKRAKARIDFSDVKGQQMAKRALLVSAAGGHSILLSGPPGSGKSMMVDAFSGILPLLNGKEALEVQRIHSVQDRRSRKDIFFQRPFRKPHQNVTSNAMVGGGIHPRPGEVTLAHRGILFLDEITEFRREALEALRQPIEDGHVTISRVKGHLLLPAQICLVATMNPCKCGYLFSGDRPCTCSDGDIRRYLSRLSGPILDRFDILVDVQRVSQEEESQKRQSTKELCVQMEKAIQIQNDRFKKHSIRFNAQMLPADIDRFCLITKEAYALLEMTAESFYFSQRVKGKIKKISRTIADLEQSHFVEVNHMGEALQYRTAEEHLRGGGI